MLVASQAAVTTALLVLGTPPLVHTPAKCSKDLLLCEASLVYDE